MTRHILKPKPGIPYIQGAAVGWDRPLQTFFAQVFTVSEDPDTEDGDIFIWQGSEPGEILDAQAAIDLVSAYVVVPDDLAAALTSEMEATIGQKDSDHLAQVKQLLFGPLH